MDNSQERRNTTRTRPRPLHDKQWEDCGMDEQALWHDYHDHIEGKGGVLVEETSVPLGLVLGGLPRLRQCNWTSYNIIPPSPTNTSPTLTQSTSNSNSASTPSTSPPQPITPRSSRSRTRYPDLGRVPLHRRGTSKTYERLEDLLREAGYKETRVFTPEGERGGGPSSERHGNTSDSEGRGSIRGGVGALVGFLAGFIPSTAPSRSSSAMGMNRDDDQTRDLPSKSSPHVYSPPASPLAHRHLQKDKLKEGTPSSSESPSIMTSSMESLEPTPRPSRRRPTSSRSTTPVASIPPHSHSHQSYQRPQYLVHRASDQYSNTSSHYGPHLQVQPSYTSLRQQAVNQLPSAGPSQQPIAHPRPSRAGAYLRHMASAPNIPKRPSSTPARNQYTRRTLVLNDSDSDAARNENRSNAEPPLPRTWLESVARAVLFGGMGAYIGGPPAVDATPPLPQHQSLAVRGKSLRPTRSSLSQVSPQPRRTKHLRPQISRSGLSDRTNTKTHVSGEAFLAPPELFMRIERGRAGMSEGEVSRTRVVCRSAPASRASSRVRGAEEGEDGKEKRDRGGVREGKERERERAKMRWRGRKEGKEGNRVPSLANTNTEGDELWLTGHKNKAKRKEGNRYLSGWGLEPDSSSSEDDERVSSSSEDEGELDLARILVPPKRQNSIKSLRKHLDDDSVGTRGASGATPAPGAIRSGRGMTTGLARGSRSGSIQQSIREDTDWDGSEAEEWGRGWVRRGARRRGGKDLDGEGEETHAVGFLADEFRRGPDAGRGGLFGSGRSATGKNRLGLPGPWGLLGGGGSGS
ncbi:hypothetical protein Hypma_007300 [Hypsizygus marmoreus]|uniref:Uncharacterized protein n=1 Tax=Hypsizygus marmoreus TaxID=39966 RepID=A0A369KH70_HYPMA|nr:hypothetical protein Hypma_007300 [Hypsizygus marmoreus]